MIPTGIFRRFNYPAAFKALPDHTRHAGQMVQIIRPLRADEADGPEQGEEQMYRVRAGDGWETDAFESELDESQPDVTGGK